MSEPVAVIALPLTNRVEKLVLLRLPAKNPTMQGFRIVGIKQEKEGGNLYKLDAK